MANVVVTQLIVDASGAKLGVAEFTAAMDKAKRSAVEGGEATATSFERAQSRWQTSLAKTDPVIKAQIAMEKDLVRQREIGANAVKLGIATQDAAGAQLDKVRQQHQAYIATLGNVGTATQKMAANTGLARYELINLSRQFQDVGVSLFSGQNPLTVAVQQGSQIADVFASSEGTVKGFFSQVTAGAARFITPLTVATAGVVALTAAAAALALQWDKVQVSSQRALIGAGDRTGTTISDLNKFTEQNSSPLGLSSKEARGLGEDFTKTGEIVISRLHGMNDAVVGFANQTGKSMDEARKDIVGFAVDPKKALDELSQTYGSFDIATRKAVDALVLADDKTGAFQVIVDALAEKSKKAADNMGFLEKAYRGVVNVLASETAKPSGLESQLEAARGKLNSAIEGAPAGSDARAGAASADIARLSREFETLQAAMEKVKAQNVSAEFNKLSTAADQSVRSIIPQIAQIEQLRIKIEALERAKAAGATSQYGASADNAALQAAQNQLKIVQESAAAAASYNLYVQQIAVSYGNVSTATALQLSSLNDDLKVVKATTDQGKLAAQYAKDYNDALRSRKSPEDASAIASAKRAISEVAVRDAALAWQQTMLGIGPAAQQLADSAQATADSYARAASAVLATANGLQAANHNGQFGGGSVNGAAGGFGVGGSAGSATSSVRVLPLWAEQQQQAQAQLSVVDIINRSFSSGGLNAALSTAMRSIATGGTVGTGLGHGLGGQTINSPDLGTIQSLYELKNAQTTDKSQQIANLNEFMAFLQTQPETIARDQQIVQLYNSIDQLRKATDSNTAAVQATLNPLYSQGHGALAIGYYHAASGLDATVRGSGGVDSVPVHIMMTPGEPIKAGAAALAVNDNSSRGSSPTTIVQNFDFSGSDTNNARRSRRQFAQGFGQTAAAMR